MTATPHPEGDGTAVVTDTSGTLGANAARPPFGVATDLSRCTLPKQVEVLLGGGWLTTTAHAVRHGRRGAEVLVGHSGRLVWISLDRLRRPASTGPRTARTPAATPSPAIRG